MYWIEKVYNSGVREAVMRSELILHTTSEEDIPFGTKSEACARQVAKAINKNARNNGFNYFVAQPILVHA